MSGCRANTYRPIAAELPRDPPPQTSRLAAQVTGLRPTSDATSGFHVVTLGVDGIALRSQLAQRAERTLDLQYFIYRGDASGTRLTEELAKAAQRGVRIRVLVDDGDTAPGDERLLALDGQPGIEIRVFNPFGYRGHNRLLRNLDFALHRDRLDYRMHNKLMIADGSIALVGGRNVGDQYFQVDPSSQFADDDVFTLGDAVPALQRSFEEFWDSDLAVPARQLALPRSRAPVGVTLGADTQARIASGEPLASLLDHPGEITWATGDVLYDSPDKRAVRAHERRGHLMSQTVEREIGASRKHLLMVSPFFVPTDRETALLQQASSGGADVRILTNSLESNPEIAAHSGYQKARAPLLKARIRLFEVRARLESVRGSGQGRAISRYGNYALHGKMYVFDDKQVLLGSWNYDQRSARINTEIGLMIHSPAVAGLVTRRFDEMTAPQAAYEVTLGTESSGRERLLWTTTLNGQRMQLHTEPSRGWWQRLKARCLSLLPLESEL